MKIATWNVNSLAVRLPQVLDWLAQEQPDVLVLQETKLTDDKFPADALADAGYQSLWFGQKTYNGVALLARKGLAVADEVRNIPGFEDPQARVIAATVDGVRVIGAYFPNGQAPDSDKFTYKMAWLEALNRWIATELQTHASLALLGDYNIAPEDRDVHDPVAWAGQIHCTPEERARFQALQALGLRRIVDRVAVPRAQLARRAGQGVLVRLDQALGRVAEPVAGAPPLPAAARVPGAWPERWAPRHLEPGRAVGRPSAGCSPQAR